MDLTILTCNYNTPDLVIKMLKSLKNVCEKLPNIMVMDTSTVIDQFDSLNLFSIPNMKVSGLSHGEAVNLAIRKIETRYVLLVDSDIIFLKDFVRPFEKFKEEDFSLMGKVVGDCGGKSLYPRVEPWYCFMDLHFLKKNKIEFFDRYRTKKSKNDNLRVYDIGSTMFEDVVKTGKVANVNLEGKYFKHYGGMSWRTQKYDPHQKDTDIDFGGSHPHKILFEIGSKVREKYDEETKYLDDIDISHIFD
jgi:glycosyltransferase involved in cell wall biosynthesis